MTDNYRLAIWSIWAARLKKNTQIDAALSALWVQFAPDDRHYRKCWLFEHFVFLADNLWIFLFLFILILRVLGFIYCIILFFLR